MTNADAAARSPRVRACFATSLPPPAAARPAATSSNWPWLRGPRHMSEAFNAQLPMTLIPIGKTPRTTLKTPHRIPAARSESSRRTGSTMPGGVIPG
jgi:hypothetical protein